MAACFVTASPYVVAHGEHISSAAASVLYCLCAAKKIFFCPARNIRMRIPSASDRASKTHSFDLMGAPIERVRKTTENVDAVKFPITFIRTTLFCVTQGTTRHRHANRSWFFFCVCLCLPAFEPDETLASRRHVRREYSDTHSHTHWLHI